MKLSINTTTAVYKKTHIRRTNRIKQNTNKSTTNKIILGLVTETTNERKTMVICALSKERRIYEKLMACKSMLQITAAIHIKDNNRNSGRIRIYHTLIINRIRSEITKANFVAFDIQIGEKFALNHFFCTFAVKQNQRSVTLGRLTIQQLNSGIHNHHNKQIGLNE